MHNWLPVFGYEGVYEVSDTGLVRRCDRYHMEQRPPLRPAANHHGYLAVCLTRESKGRTVFVHKLVCEAFHGPRPAGMTINHRNGVKTDNRPSNLEYTAHEDNIRHARDVIDTIYPTRARGARNGSRVRPERLRRGESVATAKLTEDKVRTVLALLKRGVQQREIAEQVGISQTQIWRIKVGLSWAHVT